MAHRRLVVAGLLGLMSLGAASAQVSLDLNTARPDARGCALMFVAENRTSATLDRVIYEVIFVDPGGDVLDLYQLDLGVLPKDRRQVRQVKVPYTCSGIGRMLVHDAARCGPEGPSQALCTHDLQLSSRASIEVTQ